LVARQPRRRTQTRKDLEIMKPWKGKSGEALLTAVALVLGIAALGGGVALTLARNSGTGHPSASDRLGQVSESTKPAAKPLTLGRVAKIGSDYKVAVTGVTLYTEESSDQYIAATLKATYLGTKEGDPTEDLTAEYSTTDSRESKPVTESACLADLGEPDLSVLNAAGQSPLKAGGSKTYVVCIDVPTRKLDNGQVAIAASDPDQQAFWTTKGAPSKVAPAPAPPTSYAPAADPKKAAKQLKDVKKQLKKAKKARDEVDDLIDNYKDTPGYKKKKLKKLKKLKDNYDEVIDQLEKAEKILGG